jgi:methylmalonyl-CoA mutase N-terminal domain/subunit
VANEIDNGERIVVGVNRFGIDEEERYEPLRVDPAIEAAQAARLATLRQERDSAAVESALADLGKAAEGTENVLPFMREALRLRATVGEVCHTLRGVWGVYHPVEHF